MAGNEPGDRPTAAAAGRAGRQLERAPGERYVRSEGGSRPDETPGGRGQALFAPLVKAVAAAAIGTLLMYALGALLSSSAGLVFVAGLTGAAVGLLLARAAAPGRGEAPALTRRQVLRLAVALTLLAVVIGAIGTWLHAIAEGGALGLVDYLLETFGGIVPAELVIGAIAAAWGAGAGPVER
jgi:hypothetical protein